MYELLIIAGLLLVLLIQTYRIYSLRERNGSLDHELSLREATIIDNISELALYKAKIKEEAIVKAQLKAELAECIHQHRDKQGKFVKQ